MHVGHRENLDDHGRPTVLPNGIDIDQVVAGLFAWDEELRAVGGLEPDGEQEDLEEIVSEIRVLIPEP